MLVLEAHWTQEHARNSFITWIPAYPKTGVGNLEGRGGGLEDPDLWLRVAAAGAVARAVWTRSCCCSC